MFLVTCVCSFEIVQCKGSLDSITLLALLILVSRISFHSCKPRLSTINFSSDLNAVLDIMTQGV